MTIPTAPPRSAAPLLVASAILFALFAGLSVCIWLGLRNRFIADDDLLNELQEATFVEEPIPSENAGWPQWRGPRRDGVAFASALLTTWPESGPPRLWKQDIEDLKGYSTYAVRGDRAYTMGQRGDKELVLCFQPDTGETIWAKGYDPRFEIDGRMSYDPAKYRKGLDYGNWPRSTPSLDEGRLYTVGSTGRFQCRKAADGELLWEHDLLKDYGAPNLQWGIAASPLIDGDLVFVNPGGPNGKSLAAFDKRTGKEVWTSLDDAAGYSSPIAITVEGDRQIAFYVQGSVLGVSAKTGELRWRFPWPTSQKINVATPITFQTRNAAGKVRQYVFISSGYKDGCALIAVLPRAGGGFEARRVFYSNELCSHYGTPVRVRDHIYGFDENALVCLSLRSGKIRWRSSTRDYKKGSLLAVGEYLLVLGEEGKLALLKATPEGHIVVAAADNVMENKCWTMPVLVDGRLLLRDQNLDGATSIRCHDFREK